MAEGQAQYQPDFSDYIMSLNQNRLAFQQHADYRNAEYSLGQIQNIRQQAEVGLKNSLTDKHVREDLEVEEQNRIEFEKFTRHWDAQVAKLQEQSLVQMEALRGAHEVQMNELRVYLEQTMTTQYKPSPELLNLRKIQYHLSK